ncbi:hypothetical protein CJ014_14865 [Pleomorphomonas carboxyditropha]|uniref:Uncharacterized protein n=1 Tax=Pleomorphomonas carboxyditropha TaxID=2023338 RepID=A0A2G9WV60_9HYPH|nr:hypothetical protein CJ014_14865 [Pleomorphomonas carboxyditropha]
MTVTAPAQARAVCSAPVAIPDRAISEAEATTLWGRDRGALRICEQRRAAAIAAIDAAGESPAVDGGF